MMLQAFPSAQSSITADSPKVYLFAVEDYSLEALKRACRAIVRGQVADMKPEFPPSAPKLAQIVEAKEAELKVERYEAERPFVAVGSEIWQKLSLLRRDTALPSFLRTMSDGTQVRGWNFAADEISEADKLALPPPIPEADMLQRKADLAKRGVAVAEEQDAAA